MPQVGSPHRSVGGQEGSIGCRLSSPVYREGPFVAGHVCVHHPGWTWLRTMSSSALARLNSLCCIRLKALQPTLDTIYVELGHPFSPWSPASAADTKSSIS